MPRKQEQRVYVTSTLLRDAIDGGSKHDVWLDMYRRLYANAVAIASRPKVYRTTALKNFEHIEHLRHRLALLGDVRAPSIGRA